MVAIVLSDIDPRHAIKKEQISREKIRLADKDFRLYWEREETKPENVSIIECTRAGKNVIITTQ